MEFRGGPRGFRRLREGLGPSHFDLTATPLRPDLRFGVDRATLPVANFHMDVVLHAPASVLPGTILDRSDAASLIDPLTGLDCLAVLALRFHVAHGVKSGALIDIQRPPSLNLAGVRRVAGSHW